MLAISAATAADAPPSVQQRWPERAQITAKLADLQKISTPEGIDVQEQVEVGGVPQWIWIRGQNQDNPVLLVIHGGPGTPMMPMAWAYQKPWEDYFTVVNWDQRGVGKNAATADFAELSKTLTLDRLIADSEDVTRYLRQRLHKNKIVVMGYSYGSIIGARLAMKHPEWLFAYVGVGQFVNANQEAYLYQRTLQLARTHGDAAVLKALEALAPYPSPSGPTSIEAMVEVRKSVMLYNGGWYGHPDLDLFYGLPDWSAAYTAAQVDAWGNANSWNGRILTAQPAPKSLDQEPSVYRVPFFLFQGRYDLFTPYVAAAEYFKTVDAPLKKMETFERGAHFLMFEEPGRFLVKLVEDVLPVTGGPVNEAKGADTP